MKYASPALLYYSILLGNFPKSLCLNGKTVYFHLQILLDNM